MYCVRFRCARAKEEEEIWHDYALSLWFVQKPRLEPKVCMEPLWMLGSDLGSKAIMKVADLRYEVELSWRALLDLDQRTLVPHRLIEIGPLG